MKPDKRLINTKVYVNGYNKETVKKLYELGFRWPTTDETIPYEIHPFLFMDCNGIITTSNRMDIFKKSKNREVSYAYILKLKPLIECDFKVFDKVLVRNDNHWVWIGKTVCVDYCYIDVKELKARTLYSIKNKLAKLEKEFSEA